MNTFRPLALFALGVSLTAASLAQAPPVPVETDTVRSQDVAASSWLSGTVVSRADAEIASETSGRVTWVADVGTALAAGDAVARLDTRSAKLDLQRAQSQIRRLQAEKDLAERQRERLTTLSERNVLAGRELDEAEAHVRIAIEALAQAKLDRDQIALRIEQSAIAAPFDGVVTERLTMPGEYLAMGAQAARLVSLDDQEIMVRAPLAVADHLRHGTELAVRSGQDEQRAMVQALVPVGDSQTRLIEIRLSNPRPLMVGSLVEVQLPLGARATRLTASRDALVLRNDDVFVYKVDADNKALRVYVRAGLTVDDRIVIDTDELQAGDTLVVRGAERLHEGQTVEVLKS